MSPEQVQQSLKRLIEQEMLEGQETIESTTPLLQLGLINSMSISRILSFIESEFSVVIPREAITPQNLETIESMSQMVLSQGKSS